MRLSFPGIPTIKRLRLVTAFSLISCLMLLGTSSARAQQATAQIAGTIRDESQAIVVGAKITLKNTDTNIARSVTSNKDGDYLFTLVPIGTYEVSVEQSGFSKYVRKGITLEINQNARLDVALKVGTTGQVIEVTGDVTQVDTISATL
jgi:Carboxypeptidase regulatory-like domain